MDPVQIPRATHVLGKPVDWPAEKPCGGLPIRATTQGGMPVLLSRWQPTAAELRMLNAGGSVELAVYDSSHPPVSIVAVQAGQP